MQFRVNLSPNHNIHGKNHIFQRCASYASAVREIVGNAFSSNLETWISKIPPLVASAGAPQGGSKLSKQWRNWIFGENGCRKKYLDKSLFAINHKDVVDVVLVPLLLTSNKFHTLLLLLLTLSMYLFAEISSKL